MKNNISKLWTKTRFPFFITYLIIYTCFCFQRLLIIKETNNFLVSNVKNSILTLTFIFIIIGIFSYFIQYIIMKLIAERKKNGDTLDYEKLSISLLLTDSFSILISLFIIEFIPLLIKITPLLTTSFQIIMFYYLLKDEYPNNIIKWFIIVKIIIFIPL